MSSEDAGFWVVRRQTRVNFWFACYTGRVPDRTSARESLVFQ